MTKPATLLALLRGDMRAALATLGPVRQAQRIAFLAAAGEAGVLAQLRERPATRDEIAALLGAGEDPDDALASWEAVDEVVPPRGAFSLLEVGCGSATCVRHAAARNPELTALALDLDERVVAEARASCAAWGIADRVEIARGDVLARAPEPRFDLVTLHNLVYYFPVAAREALLAKLLAFAKPGGALLVTATCRGGSLVWDVLSLWGALTEGCGRLPDADELVRQIAAAGWLRPDARRLLPGESLYRFVARAAG